MADERGEKSESRTKSLEQEAKALEKATERWNNLSEAQRKQDAYHEQLIKNQDQFIDKMLEQLQYQDQLNYLILDSET